MTHKRVDLALNAFMKSNNAHAVAFNLDTGRWQFATPVHRQAVVCVAGPVVRAHAHASCLLCCVFLFVCYLLQFSVEVFCLPWFMGPLSRCLCAVVLSRKMLISVHVAGCFAHAAFVMVQWRFFIEMACFKYVSVVDTGTAAGAREGE